MASSGESHVPNSLPFKALNEDQAASLESVFEEKEVKLAVWQFGEDRALGPDGFLIIFFRRFWELVKLEVLAIVHEFFARVSFPKIWEHLLLLWFKKTWTIGVK